MVGVFDWDRLFYITIVDRLFYIEKLPVIFNIHTKWGLNVHHMTSSTSRITSTQTRTCFPLGSSVDITDTVYLLSATRCDGIKLWNWTIWRWPWPFTIKVMGYLKSGALSTRSQTGDPLSYRFNMVAMVTSNILTWIQHIGNNCRSISGCCLYVAQMPLSQTQVFPGPHCQSTI